MSRQITDPGWFRALALSDVQVAQIWDNDVIHLDLSRYISHARGDGRSAVAVPESRERIDFADEYVHPPVDFADDRVRLGVLVGGNVKDEDER